ncbi:hypothetical protein Bca101_091087 [Brassica carinata]
MRASVGLNKPVSRQSKPAHVPYWWVNSPTLGEFCFTMVGRADIEGSKSNVAMNAWLPQASYPCGNFSDTSSFKFRRSKGSIGHAFTVRIHVPPQPNSPPENVLCPDRQAEASLGSKRRGCYPASDSRIGLESSSTASSFPADSAKPIPLAVVSLDSRQGQWESLEFPLSVPVLSWLFDTQGKLPKEPFLVRPPADTRRSALAMLAAQAARQQSTGSELGPPRPALRANPFPEVTDPFCRLPLPTLFHRPEAVHIGDLMQL